MSENAQSDRSPAQQHPGSDTTLNNISLEDSANNSIIGKVKSRVSSILPNRLSKWFSPSTKLQNDSLNGSLSTSLPARRRRRIDVEEEESYEEDDLRRDGDGHEMNTDRDDDEEENDDDDEESQNSDEEYMASGITKESKRDLNVGRQPPSKRSRLNIDVRDSPLITRHQPLLSSTPAVGNTYLRNSSSATPSLSRSPYQRFTHLNLYANQSKKEPAYNFGTQKDLKTMKVNTDIIGLISNPLEYEEKHTQSANAYEDNRHIISSRKSLNIRPASTLSDSERVYSNVGPLKRQPLSTAKTDSITNYNTTVPHRSTSTIIQEEQDEDDNQQCEEGLSGNSNEANVNAYNGQIEESNNAVSTNKRPKLINGTSLPTSSPLITESNEAILIDSASESGESGNDGLKANLSNTQRKTGLFNMSASGSVNTRNSSRTSSFGNGLNFYSHLEGRKSLFSGPNNGKSESLNNSTLSLTSLNRRQFNASIYGSTSALSDSRLLNTFSPFYKGKTTYGGAAAYNKYSAGAGASAVRITPTLIRPTSSLSTLSSSSNSLTNNINQVCDNSTISSTAKRILDLINDFATPLSEAKKMASSLKSNPNTQIPIQAKGRLNDSDLNASRAMRLSQVRSPYCRPAVILQPSGNASGRGTVGGLLPPVKELQVPTMSQLLQMKKIQNSTENARKVTQNTAKNITCEYSLPKATVEKTDSQSGADQDKQKHTNKIRNKITNTLRPSAASKGLQDEEPPPPVNLPNIAFPLMQSIPKIDIQINKISVSSSSTASQSNKLTLASNTESSTVAAKTTSFAFNPTTNKNLTQTPTLTTDSNKITPNSDQSTSVKPITTFISNCVHTYKFSEPLQIEGVTTTPTQSTTKTDINKYKFSSPLDVTLPTSLDSVATHNIQPKQPQLKEGSCLDALNKNLSLPTTSKASNSNTLAIPAGFGNQFKKSSNEWECNACMIRNKSDISKCVACETPRKQNSPASNTVTTVATTSITPSFGLQFKKSSDEWECDTCMIRNKQENTKCVACETVRKGTANSVPSLPPIKSSFGDAFKPKSDTWECPTCMISNKNEINECLACQTKKPGSLSSGSAVSSSSVPATQFKFGFANANNNKTAPDDVFKSLAAEQKASKWECDACMTRNESNRTKCACCEQPKPGMASTESTSLNSSKFKFGATAAAKFSFGFGAASNTPKENDKDTTELTMKSDGIAKPSTMSFGIGQTQPPVSTQIGFQFGIKPAANSTSESKKDETDSKNNQTSFKIDTVSKDGAKTNETRDTLPISTGFTFGSKPSTTTSTSTTATLTSTTTTTAMSSNTIAVSTPSVKFSLPSTNTNTTISNDKPTGIAAPTFNFGSSTTTTTAGGFSFGNKIEIKPTATVEEKKSLDNFAFKAPTPANTVPAGSTKSIGFGFGTSTTNISSTNTTVGSTNTATTATSSTSTASVKPIFSFSSPATSIPQATNSQATPTFGGFSFGSNSAVSTKSSTLFSNVTSTSTATTTSASNTTTCLSTSSTTTTTPASTNIFGSFGSSSNASATPIFGSSINPPANSNLSTVSSSTNNSTTTNVPQFGTFTNKTTQNVFGSFGSNSGAGGNNSSTVTSAETKPTLPVFGNVASTSTSQSSQPSSGGFVFGSKPSSNNTTLVSVNSTTSSVTSTSTTWPKNSFVFGSLTPATITNENKETTKPSLFGSFSSPTSASNNQQQTSSIFGVPSSNIASPLSAVSGTLASSSTNSSTNLFGTNSTPAATSIFGANSSGNAVTPAPAFGSSPFGGAASSTSATPTFGSTAASGATTFGGFGGATGSSSTTNVTEIKKPEAAFNFGSSAATQSTSGGFNFGSTSTTKPAFNFGSSATTQQPTFNFTGSSESQNPTKPFQFGATPSAPVFNFNRGALEGSPNAPFQFNAGAAPVSSNIFAPTPTPGAQSAQQAKRKIRAPIRRVTQR